MKVMKKLEEIFRSMEKDLISSKDDIKRKVTH